MSQRIGEKVYIVEIYVPSEIPTINIVSREAKPRGYYKVFIDAGHGGTDPGSLGCGYRESDINLQVAKKVESKLKSKGIDVKIIMVQIYLYQYIKIRQNKNQQMV